MSTAAVLDMRKEELRRRVNGLPAEVDAWRKSTQTVLDYNAHSSQLEAIKTLVDVFTKEQKVLLQGLDPQGDVAAFESNAFDLVQNVIRSQKMWDFFRDKLILRFSPTFKEALWVADTVAWDCYDPVLQAARDAGILKKAELREPPLTYLTAEWSPATWVRGQRPIDGRNYPLGTSSLPIPVIELPWDHVENTWEFLALHHEVGHDLEADLKLREPLKVSLKKALEDVGAPAARVQRWLSWQGEIFADLVALQLGGPAFAEALMGLLLLPAVKVITDIPSDPHPTPYPRILMNAAYIPTLIPGEQTLVLHGQQIAERWKAIYGSQPRFDALAGDFPSVVPALMDTALPVELNGMTVRQLMEYKLADHLRILKAVGYMLTGKGNKPTKELKPRHCVSAGRLAVTQAALDATLSEALLNDINGRTMKLVRENAKVGLRAGDTSAPHKAFIASFAANF